MEDGRLSRYFPIRIPVVSGFLFGDYPILKLS